MSSRDHPVAEPARRALAPRRSNGTVTLWTPSQAWVRLRMIERAAEDADGLAVPPLAAATLCALRRVAASPRPEPIPAALMVAEDAHLSLTTLRDCQRRVKRLGRDVIDLPEAAVAVLEAAVRGEPVDPARLAQAKAEASELACRLRLIIMKAHVNRADHALPAQGD
jgi:hypothetical protein